MNTEILTANLNKFRSMLALALMVLAMSFLNENFLTTGNGLAVLLQISVNLCLSIGMTLVIISGGIDLSVGSMLAFSGAVTAGLIKHGLAFVDYGFGLEFSTFGAVLAGLMVGAALGWCNGLFITKLRIPPFVATLGMLSVARGLTKIWTEGHPITNLGPEFAFIGTGKIIGVPTQVWIAAIVVVVFVVITKKARFGRHLYAIGGNQRAARLTGLHVNRIKIVVYTIAGALSGLAGLILTSRLNSAQPMAGFGYELDSIAAVVIGGTSLSGGRGTIMGTVLGCLIIGVLNNSLALQGVSPFWQDVIKGGVILLAVAIDKMNSKGERDG